MLTRKKTVLTAVALGAAWLAAATPALAAAPAAGTTTRVSLGTGGAQLASGGADNVLSGNGRVVAFLIQDGPPGPGANRLVVRDIATGKASIASNAPDGKPGNGASMSPALSPSGRYVAFMSYADNLVKGDTNHTADIFVHDTKTKVTKRVSVATGGAEANDYSDEPAISADGRYVTFLSDATNLARGGTAAHQRHTYLHELATGKTSIVTVTPKGKPATHDTGGGFGGIYTGGISADGRYVTFMSGFGDLVAGDTNETHDVFVRDMVKGKTTLVSKGWDGKPADNYSDDPSISANGRFITFASSATNLTRGTKPGYHHVYVYSVATGKTELVSLGADGKALPGWASTPKVSFGGRYIAFSQKASTAGSIGQIFVRDRQLKTTTLVSVNNAGAAAGKNAVAPWISTDGSRVLFSSQAANLVAGDTNAYTDGFLRTLR